MARKTRKRRYPKTPALAENSELSETPPAAKNCPTSEIPFTAENYQSSVTPLVAENCPTSEIPLTAGNYQSSETPPAAKNCPTSEIPFTAENYQSSVTPLVAEHCLSSEIPLTAENYQSSVTPPAAENCLPSEIPLTAENYQSSVTSLVAENCLSSEISLTAGNYQSSVTPLVAENCQSSGAPPTTENYQPSETSLPVDSSSGGHSSRSKHLCPFPSCSAHVVHLPRHMRQRHGWSKVDASNVLGLFGLRKERATSLGKKKQKFVSKICSVPGCPSVVKRIHNHLTDFHKIKRGSRAYKKYLQCAVRHEPKVVDSESSCGSSTSSKSVDSSDEFEKLYSSKKKMKKEAVRKKKHPSIFKKVYSSESSEDEYPAIFQASRHRNNDPSASTSASCEAPFAVNEESTNENVRETSSEADFDQSSQTSGDDDSSPDCEDDSFDVEKVCEQEVFKKFQDWLQGPDGGRKDERCAKQCSRQVQLVMMYIDKENPKLSDILSKKNLWDNWLSKFEKERKPGTVKSYLGALHHFYAFLKREDIMDVSDRPEMLTLLMEQMKLWNKSYRKLIKDRFWEKRLEDLIKIKTPEQVKCFDSSEAARVAIKILGDYQDSSADKEATQREYTAVRDYLLTEICIDNASRAGALANMTMGEFNRAQNEDDSYVVKVKKHKTFTSHGPAAIVMSPLIHKWMAIYISKMRNRLDNVNTDPESHVFLTWTQKKMHSSHVGAQIDSIWGKVFGKGESSGGATAFRKAAVSAVQEQNEDLREDLANLMAHKKSTADRYYLLQAKTKSAAKTSRQLSKIMHNKGSTSQKTDPIEEGQSMSPSGRHKWTTDEEATLETLFWREIANHSVTLEEVRGKIKDHVKFSAMRPTIVRDKVRAMFSKGTSEFPTPPEETESRDDRLKRIGIVGSKDSDIDQNDMNGDDGGSEYTPSVDSPTTTSVSRKEKVLKGDECSLFKTIFKDLIETAKPITKVNVKSRIEAEPKLSHLVKKHTVLQLADKVRTERKIFQRYNV